METARLLLAIFLPPVAVYLETREVGVQFITNLVLCLLCYLPGVVHALVLLLLRVKGETS